MSLYFMISLLLLMLLIAPAECGHDPPAVVLKRQIFFTDERHRVSVTLSSETAAATQLHTLLVFSPPPHSGNHSWYHNALIISPKKFDRYATVSGHTDFSPHRYLNLIAKGLSLGLQYDVAPYAALGIFNSGTRDYDAVLRMDKHSSVWNEYDTLLFEQSRVTLSMHRHGTHIEKQDFLGFYHLQCEDHRHRHHCVVPLRGRHLNGHRFHHTHIGRLVIDLDAPHNLLPHDLFMRWQYHGEKEFVLTEYDSDHTWLRLNRQFQYRLNHNSDDIVMGIDLVEYFQSVEYSLHRGSIVLWYSRIYNSNETYELHKWLIFWFLSLILTCISCWYNSPTYDVLQAVIRRRSLVDYPYQLVVVDLVTLTLAPVLWILVFVSGDAWHNAVTGFPHSVVMRRQLLIFSFGLYHLLLMVALLARTGTLIKQCFRHYYHYFKSFVSSKVDQQLADRETETVSVKMVLMRNLAGHTLSVTNFLLIVNYVSEEQLMYTIPLVVASLCLLYYYVKIIFSSVVYVARNGGPRQEPLFTFLFMLSGAVFIVYSVLGSYTHYTDFFMLLNSVFSELDVRSFAVELQCFVAVVAVVVVYFPLLRYVRKKQRKALDLTKNK